MPNLELPIVHAPGAGVRDGAPAITVSNAGGHGDISPLWREPNASGCRENSAARFVFFCR